MFVEKKINAFGFDLSLDDLNIARSRLDDFSTQNSSNSVCVFGVGDINNMPFQDGSYDSVICSEVLEHVPAPEESIKELIRVLKPGGVCYFAAGNKYKIIETHYNLPFLSYFPKKIANFYIRIFTNHKEYYENLKSLGQLKKLVYRFEIIDYTLKILQKPSKFSANDMIRENTLKYLLVNFLSRIGYFIIPTYVWILKKP